MNSDLEQAKRLDLPQRQVIQPESNAQWGMRRPHMALMWYTCPQYQLVLTTGRQYQVWDRGNSYGLRGREGEKVPVTQVVARRD